MLRGKRPRFNDPVRSLSDSLILTIKLTFQIGSRTEVPLVNYCLMPPGW